MKILISTLSHWTKVKFGDIYANVKSYEEKFKEAEENLIPNSTDENRKKLHKIQTEYIRHVKVDDGI